MPGRDQTGPMGMGPMTGRGAGPCGGGEAFGFGRGRRGGRGRRNMFYATGLTGWQRAGQGLATAGPPATEPEAAQAPEAESELDSLKRQAAEAAAALAQVRQRITELEKVTES